MRRSHAVLLSLFAALAAPAVAMAEDTTPPVIRHTPLTKANKGDQVTISAVMEDESEIFAPTLYFRYPDGVASTEFALRVTGQGIQASSSDFAKRKADEYSAAVNSILTQAISRATSNNNWLAEERMVE